MGRRVVLAVVGVVALAGIACAETRPARDLTEAELQTEMTRNRALAAYVGRNGMPDVAESHRLSTKPPWDDHEVTLYYLGDRTEIGFTRAWILGRPDVQIERYERPLTDEQIAVLATRAHLQRTDPTTRAEQAAERADAALARIDAAAGSAERAADRAEAIAAKMDTGFQKKLRK
jgi:hypothetical protein